jgi:hypothetical protein
VQANRADTAGGSLVLANVLFGLLLPGSLFAWIWFIRNPARLEISNDEIAFRHGRRGNPVRFFRDSGDLYVRRTMIGGKTPLHFLMYTGSDHAIPLQTFSLEEIRWAAAATEWRFVEDPTRT